MKPFFLALLILSSCASFAQQPVLNTPLDTVRSIKISLLDMLEPSSHTFLLSYEFHLGPNCSLLSEGGYITGTYHKKKANGYKIREEVRWLLPTKSRRRGYFGLQYMHKSFMADNILDEFVNRYDGHFDYFEFDYSRKVNALHLTVGLMNVGSGRQLIDVGFFVGGRKLVTKTNGVEKGWSLRNDGEPFGYEIFVPNEAPHSKLYKSFGIYFRYGFRV